jgi:hypothetical protein
MILTLRPTEEQQITWADAARRSGKPVRAFVMWAADFTAAYLREQEQQARRDPIAYRLQEKRGLGALLRAAKRALAHLPKPFRSPIHGTLQDPAGDLRRAVDAVEEFLAATGEEYRK